MYTLYLVIADRSIWPHISGDLAMSFVAVQLVTRKHISGTWHLAEPQVVPH